MSYTMVDIEADGPIPGDYSMISLGAVLVDEELDKTFYGTIKPISENWHAEALAISGHSESPIRTKLSSPPRGSLCLTAKPSPLLFL